MEQKDDRTHAGIELRSEKVRGLLGEEPPALLRLGTAVIAALFIAAAVALCFVEFPYSGGRSVMATILGM